MLDALTSAGTRIAKTCQSSETYFSLLDECVPTVYASSQEFLSSYVLTKTCNGSVVQTAAQLEALRYCNVLTSGLTIEVFDEEADFDALLDIHTIQGV
jgi:hypothetical protein